MATYTGVQFFRGHGVVATNECRLFPISRFNLAEPLHYP